MAQDPRHDEDSSGDDQLDPSSDLDMVTLYDAPIVDAEMEADMIQGVLESNGVPCILVRNSILPSLGFEVKVPRDRVEEAGRLIAEAKAAGPEAAAEAERASEEPS
jgi:hypothetical protein